MDTVHNIVMFQFRQIVEKMKDLDINIDFFETMQICESIQFDGAAPILLCHGTPVNNRGNLLVQDYGAFALYR